jgi:hypothetical protein
LSSYFLEFGVRSAENKCWILRKLVLDLLLQHRSIALARADLGREVHDSADWSPMRRETRVLIDRSGEAVADGRFPTLTMFGADRPYRRGISSEVKW